MSAMFYVATSFNQPLANWDVSNVTDMAQMFGSDLSPNILKASIFNQDISSWDVSNVTRYE